MKPIKQTRTVKEHGTGNCMQAVVASLCELELDQVPDFIGMGDLFWPSMIKFFRENYKEGNYELIEETDPNDIKTEEFYLGIGKTVRSIGVNSNIYHVVIYKDGNPVFDPHPDNTFLSEPEYFLIPTKN